MFFTGKNPINTISLRANFHVYVYLAQLTGKISSDASQTSNQYVCDANKNISGYLLWWKVKSISYGCLDKLLQIRLLNTTGKQALTGVEASSLKPRHRQGRAPSEGSRGEFLLASSEPQGVASSGCTVSEQHPCHSSPCMSAHGLPPCVWFYMTGL